VVQEPVVENGQRVGYRALRIGGGGEIGVARPPTASRAGSEEEYCSYLFDAAAFATARGWIEEAATTAQVVIVDEVSKLEVAGRGHHDAVRSALAGRALPLLGVRGDQLFGVMERFGLPEPLAAAETGGDAVELALVEAVLRALS
jgi:nucleoside-triphosphatase THEP1